ncbi:GntR family transcriptional regulator [Romboutsia sp.]|uniref:GntR family transcriptional regulator n=1 Tax=Romboutsia sp. TaxID=1965302 RepID=UPI003F417C6F
MILYNKMHRETNKEYGYRVLKDNIMNLNLKPGQLLSETELAQNLKISRTPIREILNQLKNEHLIEVKSQVGTYVSLMDNELIEEAIFMRYTLEKEVLYETTENITTDILMELEKNLFAQKLIVNKSGCDIEFHKLDTGFHKLLFEASNKNNVWRSIQKISTHYNRMRLLAEMNTDKNIVIKQHEMYIDIVKNKNNKIIDKVVNNHIIKPANHWNCFIKDNEEVSNYFK